ncbi:MAG: hypothetical protein ACPGN3_03060 [Opitutales bacterium]
MKLVALLSILTLAFSANLVAADYLLITHPSNPVNSVSAKDVESILSGQNNRWESGSAVRLAVYKGGDFHEATIKALTGRSGSQFKRFWKKLIFTGKGIAPKEQKDVAEMVDFVTSTENSFGYVPAGQEGSAKVLIVN